MKYPDPIAEEWSRANGSWEVWAQVLTQTWCSSCSSTHNPFCVALFLQSCRSEMTGGKQRHHQAIFTMSEITTLIFQFFSSLLVLREPASSHKYFTSSSSSISCWLFAKAKSLVLCFYINFLMWNSKSTENSVICIQQDREKLTGDWIQAEARWDCL